MQATGKTAFAKPTLSDPENFACWQTDMGTG
jgi:hypothetical protein